MNNIKKANEKEKRKLEKERVRKIHYYISKK